MSTILLMVLAKRCNLILRELMMKYQLILELFFYIFRKVQKTSDHLILFLRVSEKRLLKKIFEDNSKFVHGASLVTNFPLVQFERKKLSEKQKK